MDDDPGAEGDRAGGLEVGEVGHAVEQPGAIASDTPTVNSSASAIAPAVTISRPVSLPTISRMRLG